MMLILEKLFRIVICLNQKQNSGRRYRAQGYIACRNMTDDIKCHVRQNNEHRKDDITSVQC